MIAIASVQFQCNNNRPWNVQICLNINDVNKKRSRWMLLMEKKDRERRDDRTKISKPARQMEEVAPQYLCCGAYFLSGSHNPSRPLRGKR